MNEKTRILIVDDDPHLLQGMSRILKSAGYETIEAANGTDCLRFAIEHKPDLVLLDVMLPDINGVEVCKRIKSDKTSANSYVVLLSSLRTSSDDQADGLETGADGYIARPVSNRELLARVEFLLRLKRSEKALRTKTHQLNERAKELDCLFAMSKLVEKSDISLDHILQGVVDIIPPSWQYPKIACSNMILQDREFKTENYKVPVSKQSADIMVHGEHIGFLEVGYLEEAPESDEGPFLMEERNLINTITERLGRIIERKQVEEALRKNEEMFRLIVEKSPLAMVVSLGKQEKIEYLNPKFTELFGYNIQDMPEVSGWWPLAYPDEDYRSRVASEWSRRVEIAVRNETAIELMESEVTCKDGSQKIIEWGLLSTDEKNVVFGTDLTHRKRAEQEKEDLRAQLLQSQKMESMGTLATGIAHDFNNMLAIILGFSGILLADKNKGDHGYEELQKIVKTSEDAADLVQKIRIFGRRAEMNLVPLDLNHQIDQVTKLLSSTLPKMIDIEIHLTKDPVIIKADSSQITQMVMNLAVNANEAMAQGGRLSIHTESIVLDDDYCRVHVGVKPGAYVMLTVSDTGRGIDKGFMERIFDPFYSTKTRDYHKGTGLGLSVVQGIVQQHGGHITVESEIGQGTTFRMYFPALEVEIVPVYVETKIPYSAGGTETILLVEDIELVRELGVTILEKFGYTVLSAGDGQKALDVYEKEQANISLVILDIIMPRMDGKECLEELLRINPAVKVIISSGVGQQDLIQDLVEIGAKGAVNKPYAMRQLLGVVREVLDGD